MSLFSTNDIQKLLGVDSVLSSAMAERLGLWQNMAAGCAPWNDDAPSSGVIPAIIGALATPASEEIELTAGDEAIVLPVERIRQHTKELVQFMLSLGGAVVRPVYSAGRVQFEIVRLGNYIPLSYDVDGRLTSCVIAKQIESDGKKYVIAEKHNYTQTGDGIGTHAITTTLYRKDGEQLREVSLETIEATAGIAPAFVYEGAPEPLVIEFRNRVPNLVDGSGVPCALWQNNEHLIEDADKQYGRIVWEQEGGEMRVFADSDLFKKRQGEDGVKLSKTLYKLLVKVDGNGSGEEKITEHAPALRTAQQVEAFNAILRRIEVALNIGKGTISDLETVDMTATQYNGGKKEKYSMVDSIESELEEKFKACAVAFAHIAGANSGRKVDAEIVVSYNDSARKDIQQLKAQALSEVQNGIMSKAEYRELFYGEDAETAAANVPQEPMLSSVGGFGL